jgi:hypothetical protein
MCTGLFITNMKSLLKFKCKRLCASIEILNNNKVYQTIEGGYL